MIRVVPGTLAATGWLAVAPRDVKDKPCQIGITGARASRERGPHPIADPARTTIPEGPYRATA